MIEQQTFEGLPRTERRKVSVTGTKAIETDEDLKLYQRVKLVITGYVKKVGYEADGDGGVGRVHTVEADDISISEE